MNINADNVSLAIAALGIFLAMFVALLLHDPDIFGNPLNMGLLGSCALFLLCPAIGIAVLCSRAANGMRRQTHQNHPRNRYRLYNFQNL